MPQWACFHCPVVISATTCQLTDRGNACLINTTNNNVKMTYLTRLLKWDSLAVVHSTRLTLKPNGLTAHSSVTHPLPGNRDSPDKAASWFSPFYTHSRENPLPDKSWGLNTQLTSLLLSFAWLSLSPFQGALWKVTKQIMSTSHSSFPPYCC